MLRHINEPIPPAREVAAGRRPGALGLDRHAAGQGAGGPRPERRGGLGGARRAPVPARGAALAARVRAPGVRHAHRRTPVAPLNERVPGHDAADRSEPGPPRVPGPVHAAAREARSSAPSSPRWTRIANRRRVAVARRSMLAGGTLGVAAVVAGGRSCSAAGSPTRRRADRAATGAEPDGRRRPAVDRRPRGLDAAERRGGAGRAGARGRRGRVRARTAARSSSAWRPRRRPPTRCCRRGCWRRAARRPSAPRSASATRAPTATPSCPGGLRAFVVPTEDGVATVACEPPVTDACDQVASTLNVPGVVPLGPDQDLAAEVREGMTDIDDAVRSTDLRDARRDAGAARSPGTPTSSACRSRASRAGWSASTRARPTCAWPPRCSAPSSAEATA